MKALLLGAVQGIAEFFPISSSGHLSLLSHFMGIEIDLMFTIMVHLGTLFAVLMYFRREVRKCILSLKDIITDAFFNLKQMNAYRGTPDGPDYRKILSDPYRKITVMIIVAMIPTVILSLVIYPVVNWVNGNLLVSGMGLFVTGLMLMVASLSERNGKGPKEAKMSDALIIGAFQGFSPVPGISRLGMTLSTGFFCGFTAKFNRMFCFLLFVPTIIGAMILGASKQNWGAASIGIFPCILGMISAMAVGYLTICLAIKILSKVSIRKFSVYCFAAGMVSIIFYLV